ncbi:mitochondrial ribosomal protein [Jackrogersella minutella]|nr:mitochondrial ribosomal protein [Jackrogersella minutella]
MASGVQSMRLCLRAFRHAPAPRRAGARIYVARRPFSSTPMRWRAAAKKHDAEELEEDEEGGDDDIDSAEIERTFRAALNNSDDVEALTRVQEQVYGSVSSVISNTQKMPPRPIMKSFWNEEEEDPDLMNKDKEDDEFDEDDILDMAHGKFEEYREHREYARIAAWEMPLLSKLARPFEPPTALEPLRFRYTSYMGEFHPAENKVVVEFSPRDLPLDEAQQLKMKKLLGPRWNPETDVAKMSCEQFEHQAQNKRYLGDLVEKLIAQAKDTTDMFEDVPLDTRHHKIKVKPKFPKEWRINEERRKLLDDTRQKSLLLDQQKAEAGALINGKEKIEQFFITLQANAPPEPAALTMKPAQRGRKPQSSRWA